jgi:Tfp pilus assembly protein PilF
MQKDYTRALADLAEVLKREPRHFGALFGVGVIMQEFGDDKRALDAYRRALALDPHMKRVDELVKTLSEKVDGRDI